MKKRHFVVLCALLLCVSLLLQGCAPLLVMVGLSEVLGEIDDPFDILDPVESTDPTAASQRPTPVAEHIPYTEYERLEESISEPIPFSEIKYERPDAEELCADFREIQDMVEAEKNVTDILDAFMPVYEDYVYFHTLSDYAYIRYCLDLNDSYYDTEYNWCEEQSPLIEQAMEKCYIAMAESSLRNRLEVDFFGEGFFEYYDENQVYSNDRVVELMQKEAALQTEYMSLQNEMTITWEGEERLVNDLLNDPDLSYDEYILAYMQYYSKYNPLAAEIFVELVKIRNKIAAELEYESYAHFAYSYTYERDYTPEQVSDYTDSIATYLSDYYYTAIYNNYSSPMDASAAMTKLKDVAYRLGGAFATSYDFMEDYGLYDISSSPSKMPGSYATYLHTYGMPFMYVTPTGDVSDLLTAAHEFGHFTDGFVNCDRTDSIDCAE